MKLLLSNAFSIQMLKDNQEVKFEEVQTIPEGVTSYIGHQDTANVLTSMLGFEVECNRGNITLDEDTILFVAQLTGGRLPEGSATLPDGFKFKFWKVYLSHNEECTCCTAQYATHGDYPRCYNCKVSQREYEIRKYK